MTGVRRSVAALEELVSRDKHRLAQAQTMIDLFTGARGREPADGKELAQFLSRRKGGGADFLQVPSSRALIAFASRRKASGDDRHTRTSAAMATI